MKKTKKMKKTKEAKETKETKEVKGPFSKYKRKCVDKCAIVRMEESYSRVALEYGSDEYKQKVINAIEQVKKEFPDTTPYVVEKKFDDKNGDFSVEFEHEYENREVGEFIERLVEILGIGKCE
jgi:hypothetical protein